MFSFRGRVGLTTFMLGCLCVITAISAYAHGIYAMLPANTFAVVMKTRLIGRIRWFDF